MTTLLAVYDRDDQLKYRFEYADSRMPVSVTTGSGKYYLAYDQVGSLRMVIDEAGDPQRTIEYDSFGAVTIDNNHTLDIPFGFAGGLYDYDTRLCLFGYRDYDTETGRWMAKDPILFGGGDTNLYGYCVNDPVNWVDPSGLVTTIITVSDWGIGTHTAIHVDNNGSPVLYDPSGSYPDPTRGSGDIIDADLSSYVQFHLENGSRVTQQFFNTTPCEESQIVKNIEGQGGAAPFFCTTFVSSAIDGIGPFKDLGVYRLPSSLSTKLKKMQGRMPVR